MVAALAVAATAAGCGGPYGDEPDVGTSHEASTVGGYINAGTCSTSVVIPLSTQIADEVNCIAPGKLVSFPAKYGMVFESSAVLPYLAPDAKKDLLAAASSGVAMHITSAYRTVVQQYLLYEWYLQGRCNIAIAATPGHSNHESGRAIDIGNNSTWVTPMQQHGWSHDVPGDAVHFDHLASPDIRGMDVLAFQKLWNRNHPNDKIAEDGVYGPETQSRLSMAPAGGFAQAGCSPPDLAATLVAQSAPDTLAAGASAQVVVKLKNTGGQAWEPGSTFLGTAMPMDRNSDLYDPSWTSTTRPATVAAETQPGDTGKFTFTITAPELENTTALVENFSLVEEGVAWFGPDVTISLTVTGSGGGSTGGTGTGTGTGGTGTGGTGTGGTGTGGTGSGGTGTGGTGTGGTGTGTGGTGTGTGAGNTGTPGAPTPNVVGGCSVGAAGGRGGAGSGSGWLLVLAALACVTRKRRSHW